MKILQHIYVECEDCSKRIREYLSEDIFRDNTEFEVCKDCKPDHDLNDEITNLCLIREGLIKDIKKPVKKPVKAKISKEVAEALEEFNKTWENQK